MMRFKTFLEARLKPYEHEEKDLAELVELINTHCSQAARGMRIYRGSKATLKSGIFNPGSGKRTSANTSNYYTVLLDSHPKNAKWPKRSESFIATTESSTAKDYAYGGTVMILFPFNGTSIGVVNDSDFWGTKLQFSNAFKEQPYIVDMNTNWKIIFQDLGRTVSPGNIPTMDELIKFLNDADANKLCDVLKDVDLLERGVQENQYEKVKKQFIKEVPLVYSYKSLDCDLVTPAKLDNSETEIWFSGKCIGVTMEDYEKIQDEI